MNELTVAPQSLPTSTQLQAESSRAMAREQRLYANAMTAVRLPQEMLNELDFYCGTKEMAESAFYSYQRGNSVIEGPTIKLLRAVACAFGHVRSGWRILEMHDTHCEVQAYAEDLKKGSLAEIEFTVKFWRETQAGGYAITSDRDKYEFTANQASRRVRRCLEDIIPATFVGYAERICRKVLQSQGSLEDRIAMMVEKFTELGITKERLEKKLNHPVESATEGEVSRLGKVYRAIVDGIAKADEQFPDEPEAEKILKGETDPGASGSAAGEPKSEEERAKPPKTRKATRADINALVRIGVAAGWADEDAVKAELRDLGISKPSDLERSRLQEISEYLSHGPRGSWTHLYWMGTKCQLNSDGVLQLIQDVTGAELVHGGALEEVEINAIYEELDNRIFTQQQNSLQLGVPENGDTKGD